jgi:hypothetical protein
MGSSFHSIDAPGIFHLMKTSAYIMYNNTEIDEPINWRRNFERADPEAIIKKAFGKNFEFSEKYLTANIKPENIVKAIKKRYRFDKVTKATLKHILYEGARLNKVLRINDSCFEKMIDVLRIPLEEEVEDSKEFSENDKQYTIL